MLLKRGRRSVAELRRIPPGLASWTGLLYGATTGQVVNSARLGTWLHSSFGSNAPFKGFKAQV